MPIWLCLSAKSLLEVIALRWAYGVLARDDDLPGPVDQRKLFTRRKHFAGPRWQLQLQLRTPLTLFGDRVIFLPAALNTVGGGVLQELCELLGNWNKNGLIRVLTVVLEDEEIDVSTPSSEEEIVATFMTSCNIRWRI